MGTGPVAPGGKRPNWKIKPPQDGDVQGLVVSGFATLPYAEALFLFVAPTGPGEAGRGAAWLRALNDLEPVTDADGPDDSPTAIAFTRTGLDALGLPHDVLATFADPFREGMHQVDRARRLGDRKDDKWQETVIEDGPAWSGNCPVAPVGTAPVDAIDPGMPDEPAQLHTRATVHALLLLYDRDAAAAAKRADAVAVALAGFGVTVEHRLALDLQLPPGESIGREHFGFADGVSQPIPYDEDLIVLADGSPAPKDEWHGVAAGDILLGHTNAHHEDAPGPVLPWGDPGDRDAAMPFGLTRLKDRPGVLDLGLNGTYLVVRELKQDVAAFWQSLDANAARIRAHDPQATHVTADWLAERIVGRTRNGDLLCPGGFVKGVEKELPRNDLGFLSGDPHGHGCPSGAHVRRANPRDGLARDEATARNMLDSANNHRILRRGRKYGPPVADLRVDDGIDRGLLFICLNTDIVRQFEFVQQTWVLNKNFATLFDQTDPLVGPKGDFTIKEAPLRRIVEVETYIKMAGGEYFFLPSLPALRYLASL